ncbi:MAG: hypothetical protein JW774_09440, partial [Candidatus Aureabacteria bacterium]|nr:hypothetical protein [Candidatus Auribacterota bacterium]
MINKIIEMVKSLALTRGEKRTDPSVFNDLLAQKTDWTPLKRGGCNFRTHRLMRINPNRVEFRPTVFAMVFYGIFLFIGLALLVGFSTLLSVKGAHSFNGPVWVPYIIGTVFSFVGGLLFYYGTKPIVFDQESMMYWKGRMNLYELSRTQSFKDHCELKQIHAIQLISEYCRGDKSSYYSFELNLVLHDGTRLQVVDHGSSEKLIEDANTLA